MRLPTENVSEKFSQSSVLQWIIDTEQRLSRCNVTTLSDKLRSSSFCFEVPPAGCSSVETLVSINDLKLVVGPPNNTLALSHEDWLHSCINLAKHYMDQYANDKEIVPLLDHLLHGLQADSVCLEDLKHREWERQRLMSQEVNTIDPGVYMKFPFLNMEPWAAVAYVAVLCLYLATGVSQAQCGFYLVAFSLLGINQNRNDNSPALVPSTIPATVETLVIRSNIEPKVKSYVCCSRCFRLYEHEAYPASCNYTEFPGGPECKTHLRQPNGKPIREYVMQEFNDWLARLYTRPGLEELLDRDVLGSSAPERMSDIWDAPIMREFERNGRSFLRDKGTDGRLIFSINMDGFNPYGNKQSGKHVSISAIYMTCLNLPRNIRNHMENVFLVGVIPGPQEPSVLQINNLLEPLVDSLLELWDIGLYLRRTPRYSTSRRVFVAMIPLVADLVASKKMAGFGSARSRHFCLHCFTTLGNITNLDFHSWKRRTKQEHVEKAEEWKTAKTKAEQDDIFDGYGLRWSQLLRLPYWDPCSHVVIDSMHCFYLGLFHRHAVKIWGMDAAMEDGDGATYRKLIEVPTQSEYDRALKALSNGDFKKLCHEKWHVLAHLCDRLGLHFGGTKEILLSTLQQYRSQQLLQDASTPQEASEPVSKLSTSRQFITPQNACSPDAMIVDEVLGLSAVQTSVEDEIRHLWKTAPKSKWAQLRKDKLIETLKIMKPEEKLTSTTKVQLIRVIQEWRKADGIIDNEGKVIGSGMDKRSRQTTKKCTSNTTAEETAPVDLIDDLEHEFRAMRMTGVDICESQQAGVRVEAPKHQKRKKAANIEQTHLVPGQAGIEMPKTPRAGKGAKMCVLGKKTIPKLWEDMERLCLPSWVSKGPAHPGQAKGGKLHADEWRSFFTINLPITLIRLWGTAPLGSHQAKTLENFLYLVSTVKVASQRTISEEDIVLYEKHMHRYLTTLWELYPGIELAPYQHIALHFGDFLRRFGPTHGWRCFAFERYNYLLQQTLTNQLIGQMEKTMFRKFNMLQNLRILINAHHLPKQLHPLIAAYDQSFNCDIRGTLLSEDLPGGGISEDMDMGKIVRLQCVVYVLLEDWVKIHDNREVVEMDEKATQRQAASGDVIYKTAECSAGDSQVVFRPPGQNSPFEWTAGSITQIFTHKWKVKNVGWISDTFLLVLPYEHVNLEPGIQEKLIPWPFSRTQCFSFVPGYLYRTRSLPPMVLHINQALGHFALASTDYVDGSGVKIFQAIPLIK